jgi:hypothetical protein
VDEMPDAGSFADLRAGIDDGGFMLVVGHSCGRFRGLLSFSGTLPPCCDTVSKRQSDVHEMNAMIHHLVER